MGEPVHVWGWDLDGGSVLSTQLCYESKTALVNSLLLKKKYDFYSDVQISKPTSNEDIKTMLLVLNT